MAAARGIIRWLLASCVCALGLAACATLQPPASGKSHSASAETPAVPFAAKPARPRSDANAGGAGAAKDDAGPVNEVVPPLDYAHNVYFPLGSHALSGEAMTALKRHALRLNGNPRLVVTLIGHTDDLGSREYNDALCLKRAKAVEQALLGLNVSPRQIRIASRYGYEKSPAMPCRTEACRRALRRVELRYQELRYPN